MTIYGFQEALFGEIGAILMEVRAKDMDGDEVPPKGFYQQLPVVTEDEEDPSKFFPYYIIRLDSGKTSNDSEPWTVSAIISLGVYDDDRSNQGHWHLLTMIQRITDRFAAEPLLEKKYRALQDMEWAIGEEDTYPFYFGAVEIKFYVPKIGRRDLYS